MSTKEEMNKVKMYERFFKDYCDFKGISILDHEAEEFGYYIVNKLYPKKLYSDD